MDATTYVVVVYVAPVVLLALIFWAITKIDNR